MDGMRVRFWGVRGSLPAPGASTVIYGGNTSCVEVHCGSRRIVLDAGSGLRELGRAMLVAGEPCDLDLLLTHCHLDHLIGLPFFAPAFASDARLRLWAGHLTPDDRLERVLAQLMIPPLLPITPETFRASIAYNDFMAGESFDLGEDIRIETAQLRHPGGATGYRIAFGGRVVCYITDNEHAPDGPDPALVHLARNADLLICDATYTADEYRARVGWGHSNWVECARLADAADVERLALFHHLPERDDAALAAIEEEAAAARPGVFAAREGTEFVFTCSPVG